MDFIRSSKEAVASCSGRHAIQRPLPMVVRGRHHDFAQRSQQKELSWSTACRASQGSSQPQTATIQPIATPTVAPAPSSSSTKTSLATATSAAALSPAPDTPAPSPLPPSDPLDPTRRSAERVRRLTTLVETRRLFRNCIRAKYLLGLTTPLYTPPPPPEQQEGELREGQPLKGPSAAAAATGDAPSSPSLEEVGNDVSGAGAAVVGSADRSGSVSSGSFGRGPSSSASSAPSPDEDKALKAALEQVAEMVLVSEQLKASLRNLPPGFGSSLFPAPSAAASGERVREAARSYSAALRERLTGELAGLSAVSGDTVIHYIEGRNAKFSRRGVWDELQGAAAGGQPGPGGSQAGGAEVAGPRASPLERLEAAERVAGEIIANRIKPALKRASEQDLLAVVRGSGPYLRGLWTRLNGGAPADTRAALAGLDLPLPQGTAEQSELAISQLSLDLEALEKKLQEASKKRENKLRKAGLQGRVQMAIQLKGLDAEVLQLSSQLAVRTLQLEMEHVYGSLEAEALDVLNPGVDEGGLLARDGSTTELALLVAEFGLLDEQLNLLAAALGEAAPAPGGSGGVLGAMAAAGGALALGGHGATANGGAGGGVTPAGSAAAAVATAAAAMGPALVTDEVLGKLAAEIPDMRSRVGVADQTVFGGPGFSLTRARLQLRESLDKVREAITFFTRGFKLLGSDVATAARLFVKAALGNTLKPREVTALRRTARDLLTFIPFTIILIIPLSPLGHVLVFGFIQRYFPSFFPSQFSSRRQDIMVRYEELERQLLEAQAAAEAAEEEVELARAREAVARLTAPEPAGAGPSGTAAATAAATGPVAADAATAAATAAVLASRNSSGALAGPGAAGTSGGVAAGSRGAAGGVAGSLGGAGAAGGAAAGSSRGVPAPPGPLPPAGALSVPSSVSSVMSSVDEVTLQEATQKVRILAEQLDEIRDDVNMGSGESDVSEGEGGKPGGPSGRRH